MKIHEIKLYANDLPGLHQVDNKSTIFVAFCLACLTHLYDLSIEPNWHFWAVKIKKLNKGEG